MRHLDIARSILDTSVLCAWWKKCLKGRPASRYSEVDALDWARKLKNLYNTALIASPVYVEMIVGAQTKHALKLTKSFLSLFTIIDEMRIPKRDWEETVRIGQRVPRDGKKRQLGDCLIRAIANRLNVDVESSDARFPK